MPSIEESLRTLRDVEGVLGSFVISNAGSLVSKDLPAVFDDQVLGEVGPRIARLYETFSTAGDELETVMLRYAEHKLYLRKTAWGHIGILSAAQVNLPALRMVGNLVAKRIDPEVGAVLGRGAAAMTTRAAVPRPPGLTPAPPPVVVPTMATPAPPSAYAAPMTSPPTPRASGKPIPPAGPPSVRTYRGRRVDG